ncbi:ArnT family glycosyltransferase [Paenirhodobacter enshiensis]|uniref:ArnT family glycosyltransferase n=1 Tax=Paenirhodobacter enshiensis TaxID=1105367 RepID=UPI001378D5EE|nr:glycosyltransferase family 39 protein [Paenirhodobacter enshiensis]
MSTPSPSSGQPLGLRPVALAALAAFIVIAVAGVLLRPLIPIDETRYIDVAWEMRLEHSWLLPLKNYGLYTDKPPLLFWLINIAWTLTGGVTDIAGRLVAPAFGALAIWGTWRLGRRLWDDDSGAAAAIVLGGTSVFVAYGGLTMFDTMLACATLLGIGALWRAMSEDRLDRRAWALFGVAIAFGIYAKGPAILLHLGPALLLSPLWTDPARRPGLVTVLKGAGIAFGLALVLVALWVVPAAIEGGAEYRYMILWKQTAGRTVDSFAHARPLWWFVALLPVLLFPWVWSGALWRGLRGLTLADRGLRLVLVWGLSGLGLFSLVSGKQVHYLIPEMAAAALVFGRALVLRLRSGAPFGRPWLAAGLAAVLALGLVAAAFGAAGKQTAAQLQPWPAVALIAAGLIVVAALACWRMKALAALMSIGVAVVLAFDLVIGLTGLGPAYDSGTIGRMISPYQQGGIAVVTDQYHEEFDFEGRLLPPIQLPTPEEAAGWLAAHPGGVLLSECRDAALPREAAQRVPFNGTDWCLWWGARTGRAVAQPAQ